MHKIKDKLVIICFFGFIILFGLLNIFVEDKKVSFSERRLLKQASVLSDSIFSSGYLDTVEDYLKDQFVGRDSFKKIKSVVEIDFLKKLEINDYYVSNSGIYKINYPINKESINNFVNKIDFLNSKYLVNNKNKYFVLVPEKNNYVKSLPLKIDYQDVLSILEERLNYLSFFDIEDDLAMDSYYKSDIHWNQVYLLDVIKSINDRMNLDSDFDYEVKYVDEFKGSYYGVVGSKKYLDKLEYLTNDVIDKARVVNVIEDKVGSVYDLSKVDSIDMYDVFLSGQYPILEINNDFCKNKKQLIVFKDSFANSLVPLLINNYEKIILVDIRYISSNLLDNYIQFSNQDVLFLYSTEVINYSYSLK